MSITISDRLDHTMSLNDIDEIVDALGQEREGIRRLTHKVGREWRREEWPEHAWPGGYTIVYVCDDGDNLCAPCMNNGDNPVHFAGESDGWKIIDAYLAEEVDSEPGEQVVCAHCNTVIYPTPEE